MNARNQLVPRNADGYGPLLYSPAKSPEFTTGVVELSKASFLYANLRGLAYDLAVGLLFVLLGFVMSFVFESTNYTPFMMLRTLLRYTSLCTCVASSNTGSDADWPDGRFGNSAT